MDLGPQRSHRSTDRGQSASARPQQPVAQDSTAPSAGYRESGAKNAPVKKSFFKKVGAPVLGLVLLLVILAGVFFFWNSRNADAAIDGDKYQAVFFENGQVYFGKLQPLDTEYMKLTDIYYLQADGSTAANDGTDSENPQDAGADQGSVQLIKLGEEIHGPEDEMIISRDQLMFYENLKTDSRVSELIKENKASE